MKKKLIVFAMICASVVVVTMCAFYVIYVGVANKFDEAERYYSLSDEIFNKAIICNDKKLMHQADSVKKLGDVTLKQAEKMQDHSIFKQ